MCCMKHKKLKYVMCKINIKYEPRVPTTDKLRRSLFVIITESIFDHRESSPFILQV